MFGFAAARREITVDDKPSKIEWTLDLKPRSEPEANAEETFSVPSEDSVSNQNVYPNGLEPGRRLGDFRCEHWMSRP